MSENPMSSLRMIRMLGLSEALPPFDMVLVLLDDVARCSGMAPRQTDAEAEIVRQIDRAQQFQRASVLAEGQAFDRQQRAAGLHAQKFCAGGIGKRGADGLLRFLDGKAEFVFEYAVHDDRDEIAL